jgi:hypothetical protein
MALNAFAIRKRREEDRYNLRVFNGWLRRLDVYFE